MLAAAAQASGKNVPAALRGFVDSVDVGRAHEKAASALLDGEQTLILLSQEAGAHAAFSELRMLAAALADMTGATLGYLSPGANSAGLSLAGVLPHRAAAGTSRAQAGAGVDGMLESAPDCLVLWNVEPELDLAASTATILFV